MPKQDKLKTTEGSTTAKQVSICGTCGVHSWISRSYSYCPTTPSDSDYQTSLDSLKKYHLGLKNRTLLLLLQNYFKNPQERKKNLCQDVGQPYVEVLTKE